MKERESQFKGKDGSSIGLMVYEPDQPASGIVIGVHGFAEYGLRYRGLAGQFTEKGFGFYIHDQRGHGRTPGPRGVIRDYEDFLDDIDQLLELVKAEHPGKPILYYGHSMGGNIALNHLIRRQPEGVVLGIISSPWLHLHKETPLFLIRLLEKLKGPDFTVETKLHALSHDREYLKAIAVEELYHKSISTHMAKGIMEAGLYALNHPMELKIPTLLMAAGEDLVVDTKAIDHLAHSGNEQILYLKWPGLYHELHNEFQRDEVFSAVWEFISENLGNLKD